MRKLAPTPRKRGELIAALGVIYSFKIYQEGRVDKAKVFWSGRSQAVRLPKDYRIEADEVRISRRGDSIILEPIPKDWSWLDAIVGTMSEGFMEEGREQPPMQERPLLDKLF